MRPIILSEGEKKLYKETLNKEKGMQKEKRTEERKEQIKKMAKNKAKPLKEKIKKGVDFLSKLKLREL